MASQEFFKFIWSHRLISQLQRAFTEVPNVFNYQVENLGAGVDIETRAIFEGVLDMKHTITSAKIISQGTPIGIDNSNTCVISILNGTNVIATKTYDTAIPFPANNVSDSLGELSEIYKVLENGEKLHLEVTNGATADPPAFMLEIQYKNADVDV